MFRIGLHRYSNLGHHYNWVQNWLSRWARRSGADKLHRRIRWPDQDGVIWWHFEVDMGTSWDSFVVVRLSSPGFDSVDIRLETPSTGTSARAGAGGVEVYTWGWGQIKVVMGTGLVCTNPPERRPITWAAGEPNRATSSCGIASTCSRSAMLLMWLAGESFAMLGNKVINCVQQRRRI